MDQNAFDFMKVLKHLQMEKNKPLEKGLDVVDLPLRRVLLPLPLLLTLPILFWWNRSTKGRKISKKRFSSKSS